MRRTILGRALVLVLAVVAFAGSGGVQAATEVSFTDGADDAYRLDSLDPQRARPPASQPPLAAISDPTADILEASFARKSAKGKIRTYTASMEIAGSPSGDYSYVVSGRFNNDCWAYHFLTPGHQALANLFCNENGDVVYRGSLQGNSVVVDGSTVTATFTFHSRSGPAALVADPHYGTLQAFTCVSDLEGRGCQPQEVLDAAHDPTGTLVFDV